MSVTTQPRQQTSPAAKSGPLKRVIAASLAAGLLAALVLTTVVFPGAIESVTTGSFLVGFGFGWALLATLTRHYTTQPQRWAIVPAGVMGATGVALLVFAPGTATMTTLNWIWPPVVLTMAIWSFLQMRQTLPGHGARWLLTPVFCALGLASIGATYANVSPDEIRGDGHAHHYDVDGRQVHLACQGQGSPTVVLSNGLDESAVSWARVIGLLAQTTRVCAFDRPGQGQSEAADVPQDGVAAAKTLHTVLAAAGETGRFVLVGHSTGGPYALAFAARYPDQVAGMVLLDSSSPEQFTRMPAYPRQYAMMRRGAALIPTLHRLGLGGAATPRAAQNPRDELAVLPQVLEQARATTTLGRRPLVVLTAAGNTSEGWDSAQDQLANLSGNSVHHTVRATHAGLIADAGPAAESAGAVTAVVTAIRAGTPLHVR